MSDVPPQLRRLFADEAANRLTRLSEELLALEEREDDAELVASVFRDAHTLKGSAGMLGMSSVANVAHRMEDLLDAVRAGRRRPTPALVDALLAAVDGLRAQLPAMAEGTPDDDALGQVLAELDAFAADESAGPAPAHRVHPAEPPHSARPPQPAQPARPAEPAPPAEPPAGPPAAPPEQVERARPALAPETARVPVARLEALVRLAEEANAVHARLAAAVSERLGPGASLPVEVHALGAVLRDLREHALRSCMVPVANVVAPLRRAVRDVARGQGKDVRFEVLGEDTELDRGVLDRLADPLLHLVRNAVDHGVEPPAERQAAGKPRQATVRLAATPAGAHVTLVVSDDGRGLDVGRIRASAAATASAEPTELIFQPGFTTAATVSTVSGRGVGLDVVRHTLDPLRGRVEVRSEEGRGASFVLTVPLTVALLPCLIVEAGGHRFALPLDNVTLTVAGAPDDVGLGPLLGLPDTPSAPAVVLTDGKRERRLGVSAVVEQRDLVVKGLAGVMPAVEVVAGAAADDDGTVIVVLDPSTLLDLADHDPPPPAPQADHTPQRRPEPAPRAHARILVVDDAATVREAQRAILARAGYEVDTAVDGADALARLRAAPADLVLVDVEMPVMDGLRFTTALREDPALRGIAVIILTSLGSPEDRRRGMEAGADAYLVKGTVTPDSLLDAVARLLGHDE